MAVRTTVDIPEPLHDELKRRAQEMGTSIRALIVRAIEQTYADKKKARYVTSALVKGSGKLGPDFPKHETPYELILP